MAPSTQRPNRRRAERSPSSGGEGPSNTNASRRDLNLPDLDTLGQDDEMSMDEIIALLNEVDELEEEGYPEDFDYSNIDYKKLFPMFDLENMPVIDDITEEDINEMLDPNSLKKMVRELKALGEGLPDMPELQTEEDRIREIRKIEEEVKAKVAKETPKSLEEWMASLPDPDSIEDGPAPDYPLPDFVLKEYRKYKDSMDPNIHPEPKIQRKALEKFREDSARLGDILRIYGRPPNEVEMDLLKKNEEYAKGVCDHLANFYQMHAAMGKAEEQAKTGCYGAEKTPKQVFNEEMDRWTAEYEAKSEFEKFVYPPLHPGRS